MAKHADAAIRPLNGSSPAPDPIPTDDESSVEDEHALTDEQAIDEEPLKRPASKQSRVRDHLGGMQSAIIVGVVALVALGSIGGWLGYHAYQTQQTQSRHDQMVAAARRGALNLTTLDYNEIDTDVQRILESTTGVFHDDFQKRSQPFIDAVKQAKSKSEGTITAAGLESQDGDQGQVLVTVSMKTWNAGEPNPEPRAWRMRIGVQKVGPGAKVSAVQFVP